MSVFACICSPSSSAFRFFKLSLYKFLPFINTKQHNIKEKKRLKKKREKNIPLQAKTSHNPIHKTKALFKAILCHKRIKKTIRQDTFYWYNNSFVDAKHSHGKVLFSTVTPAAGHKYTVGLLHVRDKLARNY